MPSEESSRSAYGVPSSVSRGEPEPVREPVGGRVALGVVDRDRLWRESFDGRTEVRPDALVVADHLVCAERFDARCVETSDDRDALAGARDEERALPGAVRAGDQVETRVGREQRLADEREPEVDVLLLEDPDGLLELLANEALGRDHPPTLSATLESRSTSNRHRGHCHVLCPKSIRPPESHAHKWLDFACAR